MPRRTPTLPNPVPDASLTDPMRRAAKALANGATREDAALDAGVTRKTLAKWFSLPHFLSTLHYLQGARVRQLGAETESDVRTALPAAIREMRRILDSPDARDSARIAAARVVVAAFDKTATLAELDARIDALERDLDDAT